MIKADKLFIENLKRLKEEGVWDENPRPKYETDNASAHSIFINQVIQEFDLNKNEFPITTLRPIAIKSGIKEIMWIYKDQTSDVRILEEKYNISWWKQWVIKATNSIGLRYGQTVKKYNLMNNLLEGLVNDPFGRRHVMSLYQNQDFLETEGLIPCAFLTMWSVRKIKNEIFLDCTLIQRSSDNLVAGHINSSQYVALQMMVAKHCGYKIGKFVHFIQNFHCYDRHQEQLNELLSRTPVDIQPIIKLNIPDGTNFYDITIDDFEILNYHPIKPQLKFELAI